MKIKDMMDARALNAVWAEVENYLRRAVLQTPELHKWRRTLQGLDSECYDQMDTLVDMSDWVNF